MWPPRSSQKSVIAAALGPEIVLTAGLTPQFGYHIVNLVICESGLQNCSASETQKLCIRPTKVVHPIYKKCLSDLQMSVQREQRYPYGSTVNYFRVTLLFQSVSLIKCAFLRTKLTRTELKMARICKCEQTDIF